MSNIKQPETKFEVYEGETDGKVHEMPEKYDIPYLEMFLNTEALFTQNGDHMKSDEVIGISYQENGEPVGI